MRKRIVATLSLIAMLFTVVSPLSVSAAWRNGRHTITTAYTYETATEQVTHNGLKWQLQTTNTKTATKTSDNGTPYNDTDNFTVENVPVVETTVGRINEAGNLEISTKDKPDAQSLTYYKMQLNAADNSGTDFAAENFAKDHDFEMKFRYSDRLQLAYNGGSGNRYFYIDFYSDSKIYYADSTKTNQAIEADASWDVWHTLKLSTRGTGSATIGTIYLDGKEIISYNLPTASDGSCYFWARTYNHSENRIQNLDNSFGTPDQFLEVEYVTLTPVTAAEGTISLIGIADGQTLSVGDSVTLKTNMSANGSFISAAKKSSYYINGSYAGLDATSGSFTITNNGYTHTFDKAGIYRIYGEYDGSTTATATVTVVDNGTASLAVPSTINYGETMQAVVSATGISDISSYEYYVNGQKKTTASSTSATLSGLRAGTAAVMAKVICSDGREYLTDTQYVNVNKGAVTSGEVLNMSREYRLDFTYDGTSGSTITANDGYFNLALTYDGNTIGYIDNDGNNQTYTGVGNGIGAGDYRIVATAGNAEIYYNNHFLFSCLMPYTSSQTQSISYSGGISEVNLYASGVKAERYFGEWNTANSIEAYGFDVDLLYSLEFNKADTQAETVVVYDGQYQGKLIFDQRGITAITQPEDYKVPKEETLTNTIKPGYYRLTVAVGLAQLFVDNVYIASFKMPYNPHAKAVMRSAVSTASSRMLSVKNTDDVYYHTETFEDQATEYGASDYWFSEEEARAIEDGQEDPFTQEYITEGSNGYLKITDVNMQKPFYADEAEAADSTVNISQPVADWNLNAVAINPKLSWRAKADGNGEIHFIVRHYKKGFFVSASYDFDANQWKLNRYSLKNKSLSFEADPQKDNIVGNVAITKMFYLENEVLTTSNAASPGTNWNDYTMVVDDENITLACNGEVVLTYSGLYKGHGKVGFGVSGNAALCIDDVVYEGDGKASPGMYYFSVDESIESSYQGTYTESDGTTATRKYTTVFEQGVKDFYKGNESLGVVASGSIYKPYNTTDGGKTWNKVVDSGGHHYATGLGYNTLNLLSGAFMRTQHVNWGIPQENNLQQYDPRVTGNEILDMEWGSRRLASQIYPNSNAGTVLNGAWPSADIVIEPDTFEAYKYNNSNIASQLVQAQSGDYEGRIFMTKSIGGERYGGEALFYTDVDKKFLVEGESLSDYWDSSTNKTKKLLEDNWSVTTTPLTYAGIGVDFAESKVVDLDDSIRVYGRTTNGFLYYTESFDGGDTWGQAVASQFISPRASYGVVRDPQNLDVYYACWTYDANTVLKASDGGRPRNRVALAVSYDGMKTWQYVMDLEEFTYSFNLNHDGVTALSAFEDHGVRVIDGVVYINYDGQGTNFTKIFTVDTNKVKPLKRFTSVHEKKLSYTDGAGLLLDKVAVLPKESGKGMAYGVSIPVDVTDGSYDDTALTLAFGTAEGNSIQETAANADLNIVETDTAYIISNREISRVSARYLCGLGTEMTFEQDNAADFINRFNVAAEYGQTDKMAELLDNYSSLYDFSIDTSNTDILKQMTGYSYYKIEDIGKVYNMLKLASEKESSTLVLSTVSDGFANWDIVAENGAASASIADSVVTVTAQTAYTSQSEYGTAAFEVPDCDVYALNFDAKVGANKAVSVKWGNSSHLMKMAFNSGSDFSEKPDEIPVTVTEDKWYNFRVMVEKSGVRRDVTVQMAEIASDGTVGAYTETTFAGVTGTEGRPGFWLEVLDGSASIRNVRLYTDTIIEVLSFSANNGVAQAEVEILNFDKAFSSAEVIMNLFNDNIEAGVSVSEALTEPIPEFGTKKIPFSAEYDKKLGVNPKAKFHIWKDTLNLQPLAEPISGIAMDGAFEDNFSKAVLDTDKWSVVTDSDGAETGVYAGISADDGGVLKLKKDIAGSLAVKANFEPQPDNAVLMFDFKADAMPRLLQCQWYGNVYTNAEDSKMVDRVVFYLQEAPDTGKKTLYCSSTSGYQHYVIEEGCWYSLAIEASGAGSDREYKFYLKKQGDSVYERLWSDATFAGSAVTGLANANTMQIYEAHQYTDDQSTIVNIVDVSIDDFKVLNGAFSK